MGAGRGRSRRVQTNNPRIPVFSEGKFPQFVRDNQLDKVNLYGYYLGKRSDSYTEQEHQKVLTELFRDAVEVGAIILPDYYDVDDIKFEVKLKDRTMHIVLDRRKNNDSEIEYLTASSWFYPYVRIDDTLLAPNIESFLNLIFDQTDKLINESEMHVGIPSGRKP